MSGSMAGIGRGGGRWPGAIENYRASSDRREDQGETGRQTTDRLQGPILVSARRSVDEIGLGDCYLCWRR
jgi:hypothetical protein